MSDEIITQTPVTDEEPRVVVFEEALEAILFAAGHPISYSTLARIFQMTPAKVKDKVFEYCLKYNDPEIPRGVILLVVQDSCQLCTKQHYLAEIRDALGIKKSGTLSTSSLEVLAIIAYNQPVTRAFVDTLRRVDSSYAMNNLLDRGLITSKGRLDVPGRPMLYGTTSDFLRCFGLESLEALPKTSDELIDAFNGARADEANASAGEGSTPPEIEGGEQLSADIDSAMPNSDAENGTEAIAEDTTVEFDEGENADDIYVDDDFSDDSTEDIEEN